MSDVSCAYKGLARPWAEGHVINQQSEDLNFPIVCVGGSAGSLDAFTRLVSHLPADVGAAIVIVNHLRKTETSLHKILLKYTQMPVQLIKDGLVPKVNHIFVSPGKHDLLFSNRAFQLRPVSKPRGWPDIITIFLRSLTDNWNGQLIAVIVSGFDGDGTEALRGIKETGGITIAQEPETAGQSDMPESAISSGYVDFVLSPEAIAQKIIRIARNVA